MLQERGKKEKQKEDGGRRQVQVVRVRTKGLLMATVFQQLDEADDVRKPNTNRKQRTIKHKSTS